MSITLMLAVLAGFQASLDEARISGEIPGVSAVVSRHGEEIFAGASGLADIETGREMSVDTVLYSGSLSKIFTAVLTLSLIDDGKLSLDDVVPNIAIDQNGVSARISIEQLMTHSSGLVREGDFGYWFSGAFPDTSTLTDYLATTKLRVAPGEAAHYSNVGYAALGIQIERASGHSYADALTARVLSPLGMKASGAPGPVSGIARGYTPIGRIIPNEERPFAGVGEAIAGRHVREYHNAGAMTPAFGVYTSVRDLAKLARSILGYADDTVISEASRNSMLTPRAFSRSLGLRITELDGRRVARHDGWFAAHKSHLLLDLESGISIVVLANSDNAAPDEIAQLLLETALSDDSRL